jgi:hypothetical protein
MQIVFAYPHNYLSSVSCDLFEKGFGVRVQTNLLELYEEENIWLQLEAILVNREHQ